MKRIISLTLTVCAIISLLSPLLSLSASAAVSHVQKDKGLTMDDFVANDKKSYSSDYYETDKRLDAVPYTFEAWVKIPSHLITSNCGTIIGNHSAKAGGRFKLEIEKNLCPTLALYNRNGASHIASFTSDASKIYTGGWEHIVITVDEEASEFRCYINGKFTEAIAFESTCGEKCANGCLGVFSYDSAIQSPIALGGDFNYLNSGYFKGALQDVAMYSAPLTSEEIKMSFENGIDADHESLILYYDIDASDKHKDIKDESGNGYDMFYNKNWLTESEMQAIRDELRFAKEYAYSVAVIGDPQYATRLYPDTVETMYQWIVDNQNEKDIQYVIGLGDITDDCTEKEWIAAAKALKILEDANIEYSLIRGNHDAGSGGNKEAIMLPEMFDEIFANNEFYTKQFDEFGGYYKEGSVENTYRTITWGETDWLIVNIDYSPKDAVLQWASEVVASHPNHKAIIVTHDYLRASNETSSIGNRVWDQVASKHKNVVMVLAGHVQNDNIRVTQEKGIHGNTVTQMLIDPQHIDLRLNGVGIVAMFYFREDGQIIDIEYYSTVKDRYFKNKNQLSVDLEAECLPKDRLWNGTDSTAPLGTGTESDPYRISKAANLLWIAEQLYTLDENGNVIAPTTAHNPFKDKYFIQTNNINLSGYTLPSIGYYFESATACSVFGGTYDGCGYKIVNGYVENPLKTKNASTGLFGEIYGATIKNLTLDIMTAGATKNTGLLVGRANECDLVSFIESCKITASCKVLTSDSENGASAGMLIGKAASVTIANCENNAKIKAGASAALGGIVGTANGKVSIYNAANNADVEVSVPYDIGFAGAEESVYAAGAIIGKIEGSAQVLLCECENTGDFVLDGVTTHKTALGAMVGIFENAEKKTTIISCTNRGEIISKTTQSDKAYAVMGLAAEGDNTGNVELIGFKNKANVALYPDNAPINAAHGTVKYQKFNTGHNVSCDCGCGAEYVAPHKTNEAGFCDLCEASISGASLTIKDSISLKYYVTVNDESIINGKTLTMEFDFGGTTTVAQATKVGQRYVFVLDSITPEKANDKIDARLILNDGSTKTVLASKNGYSVKQNCLSLLKENRNDEKLCALINDFLTYSNLLQRNLGHGMNTPISSGINTTPTAALPTDSDKISISGNKNKDCRIVNRGINVDTGISVYLKLKVADVNAFELRVNGVKQDITKLQSEGEGEYLFTYTALSYAEIG
ncbi:MAG: metallophosphoesterase, partial [Clostridia bacterium]|nr:metallophosphoesterase [Clostridia bacterium]